jgi:hypothetical protein
MKCKIYRYHENIPKKIISERDICFEKIMEGVDDGI